ncbi:glycosyltransferase family 2 protein [Candidatus Uhrbacteria bacterium]|nr:glycosyltransferase family 2 protein [Candidatus Uhrbacteria bacterium]
MINLSVIIVSWNVREALKENIARLFELETGVDIEIIVVDNASSDGSRSMVRSEFPQVELVANDWNSGFAHACNQGLRIAKGEVVLLLNPDMLVGDRTLDRTHELLTNDPSMGVLGVKLIGPDGSPLGSVRRDPGLSDQLAILMKIPHILKLKSLDRYHATDMQYGLSQEVDQVRGSYFAFRRELMDSVGLFDERFHLWFEEVDYCRRVREAGYTINFCADVSCKDLVGKSFAQVSVAKKQRMFSSSMAKYFRKWHPWWHTAIIRAAQPAAILSGHVHDLVKR